MKNLIARIQKLGAKTFSEVVLTPGSRIVLESASDVSLNVLMADLSTFVRNGDDLVITLANGEKITFEGFFAVEGALDTDETSRLLLSKDGETVEVSFAQASEGGALDVEYRPVAFNGETDFATASDFASSSAAQATAAQGNDWFTFGTKLNTLGLIAGAGAIAAIAAGGGGGGGSSAPSETPEKVPDAKVAALVTAAQEAGTALGNAQTAFTSAETALSNAVDALGTPATPEQLTAVEAAQEALTTEAGKLQRPRRRRKRHRI